MIYSSNCICCNFLLFLFFFFFKQKTAYDMRISDWSSDVCSSDLDTASARGWNLCGKPERFVEIDRVDQIKPRKLFLGFRKRAVGNLEIGRASCRERVCQYV